MEVCSGAVSVSRSLSFCQSWRSVPPLRWFGPYISTIATESGCDVIADSSSGPCPAGRTTLSSTTKNPRLAIARTAPSSGTSNAGVPTTRTTSAPTNQPTASPSNERAGTTALTTRWIGTKASSSVHHHRRHRAGCQGPDTVSTAASIAIHRGSSMNCDERVENRSDRSKCHRGAAMPLPLIDRARSEINAAAAYALRSFH